MKRFLTMVLIGFVVVHALSGCGEVNEERRALARIGKELGVDLFSGRLIHFEDSHGGFHGDGKTTAVVELDGLEETLTGAAGWKPLPLSENAARAVRLCGGEGAAVQEGFYYLYDRHSGSRDPYDDTQLHSRASWNFSAAVYDSQNGVLYFYQFDT